MAMDRRRFLALLSASAATLCTHGVVAGAARAAQGSFPKAPYIFFSSAEGEFIEAAVARLIPADALGPGALEAGVPYFIDRQLAGEYGAGARFYSHGPFGPSTPLQGYQLPLAPRELYRVGIAATDRYCEETYGKRFSQLVPSQQDKILEELAGIAEDKTLSEFPGAVFFNHLLGDTKDGFFSDPAYGGNRDMIGWRLVGFPGVAAVYSSHIGKNVPYDVEPEAMARAEHGRHDPKQHVAHVTHVPRATARKTSAPQLDPEDPPASQKARPSASFSV
jgi:gluconate 2-dehydrogenase gamma chain